MLSQEIDRPTVTLHREFKGLALNGSDAFLLFRY